MSFGFKYGVPLDADFVFDLRFLPNPFWVPELRPLTGRDEPVAEFVLSQPGAAEFLDDVTRLMASVATGFVREGRRYVTLAVGCTGGKHRSVAMAEQLAQRLVSDDRRHLHRPPRPRAGVTARMPVGAPASRSPRVVALGGGHGLATSLSALKLLTDRVTAVVTVADDGGSSGRLRDEFSVLPPGDLRMALAALCDDTEWGHTWRDVLQHRFRGEGPLAGHALGNLLIVSLWDLLDDTVGGLDLVGRLLNSRGRVLPMAGVPLEIEAEIVGHDPAHPEARSVVRGQHRVASSTGRVEGVRLIPPDAGCPPETLAAVHDADWVVLRARVVVHVGHAARPRPLPAGRARDHARGQDPQPQPRGAHGRDQGLPGPGPHREHRQARPGAALRRRPRRPQLRRGRRGAARGRSTSSGPVSWSRRCRPTVAPTSTTRCVSPRPTGTSSPDPSRAVRHRIACLLHVPRRPRPRRAPAAADRPSTGSAAGLPLRVRRRASEASAEPARSGQRGIRGGRPADVDATDRVTGWLAWR